MNEEVRRYLSFVLVGTIAALVTTCIDYAFKMNESGAKPPALIALILLLVFIIGYLGTSVAEFFGTDIERAGGRLKVFSKALYIYLVTWFVLYVMFYNAFVFPG